MKRNLIALGLTLVATFATSAVAASGAQAAHFTAGNGTGVATTFIEAHPNVPTQTLETTAGFIECEEVSGMATTAATTESETSESVSYEECNIGGLFASVKSNGCQLDFHAGTKTAAGSEGTVDLVCTGTNQIEIIAAGCTVKVGSQTGLGPVKYTNAQTVGKPKEVTIHAEIKNIAYTHSGISCGTGSASNGVYEGTTTAWAETTNGTGNRAHQIDDQTTSTCT